MCLFAIYISSGIYGEISVKAFGPFINCVVSLLLSFNILSYILDSSPLSDLSFAHTYSQFVACFILLTLSFIEQIFKVLIKFSLPMIYVMNHAADVGSEMSSLYSRSSRFPPRLSSRSFIVLCFTFKSVDYFELIFLKDVWSRLKFIYLHVNVQMF